MNNIRYIVIFVFFLTLVYPYFSFSQKELTFELGYEVKKIPPPISISREKLKVAQTLVDLNRHYKASWVKEFISVEILTSHNGKIRKTLSENDTLSEEQRINMNLADEGTGIDVKVEYIPNNTLLHNDRKEINFTFTIDPEHEARFANGQQQLMQYLKDNALNKITDSSFNQYQLTVIKFIVDEQGQILHPHVFESSKNEQIDELLLETICNMPNWIPATYASGKNVKQEFAFTIGDHRSCVINLLYPPK